MQEILIFLKQHSTLSTALIIVLILLFIVELMRQKGSGRKLSPAEATQLMNRENAVVIDLRNMDAFKTGHILGSLQMNAADITSSTKKLEKHKSRPIIVVCATGTDAERTATHLMQQGMNAYVLKGGIGGWVDADMPLVKD